MTNVARRSLFHIPPTAIARYSLGQYCKRRSAIRTRYSVHHTEHSVDSPFGGGRLVASIRKPLYHAARTEILRRDTRWRVASTQEILHATLPLPTAFFSPAASSNQQLVSTWVTDLLAILQTTTRKHILIYQSIFPSSSFLTLYILYVVLPHPPALTRTTPPGHAQP